MTALFARGPDTMMGGNKTPKVIAKLPYISLRSVPDHWSPHWRTRRKYGVRFFVETLTVVIKECAHCVITIKPFPPGGAMYTRPILQLMGNLHQSRRSTIAIMVDNLFFTPSVWCKVPDHHSGAVCLCLLSRLHFSVYWHQGWLRSRSSGNRLYDSLTCDWS